MSAKQLTAIIIVLIVLSLGGWLFLAFVSQVEIPQGSLVTVNQQATKLEKKLQDLLTGSQNGRFQEFQKSLRSFVQLPLPARAGGKDNPFLPVTEQPNQFSRVAGSVNATPAPLKNK
ncbi:MAG: hypothetical protein NTV81_00655 [Candidatus Komeilibacteria bacterium]|nr:hypothetical protein [Candidatus Komeilibacteria bacterium]